MKRVITATLLVASGLCSFAGVPHQIGVDIRPTYVIPTRSFFAGNNDLHRRINHSEAVHLKYAFRFSPDSYWGRTYPTAYQGIGVGYHAFHNRVELGAPVSVYAFQGARIAKLSPRLSLDYEWNFGASFGWKKYHEIENPYNDVVGSKINAYINLGFLLNWQLNKDWNVTAGVDVAHFSDGNTNYPNSGINTVGARIGVTRTFAAGSMASDDAAARQAQQNFKPHFSYDVVVYGAARKRGIQTDDHTYMVSGSFGVAGINVSPMYNFHRNFRLGVSLDAQFDEGANIKDYEVDKNKFHRPPFREQFAVGASLRAEWVMSVFSVNVGVGRNLIYKGDDTKGYYQVLALKTDVTHGVFLHVGYQLSKFKDPNNLMLGLGYRFHDKHGK